MTQTNPDGGPLGGELKRTAGLLAEYETPAAVYRAAERVRDAGYTRWDVHTPFPVHGMDDAMGLKPTPLGYISLAGGITGGSCALLMQWWMNGYDYPLNIGGKPSFAFQAFVPVTFELTILLTAFATLFGMLGLNRLPQLYHWAFYSRRFARATDDRFFITIEVGDPKFDLNRTRGLLDRTNPLHVEQVSEEVPRAIAAGFRETAGMTFEALTGVTSPFKEAAREGDPAGLPADTQDEPPSSVEARAPMSESEIRATAAEIMARPTVARPAGETSEPNGEGAPDREDGSDES